MTVCAHFGLCGGCAMQDIPQTDYRAAKRRIVTDALARAGLAHVPVAAPVTVPLQSRRRAVFKFKKANGAVAVGFHARASHSIVDMLECLVLTPALFALAGGLRAVLAPLLKEGESGEVHATDCDNGLDLAFRWNRKLTPSLTADLAGLGNTARIIFNNDILLENAPPEIALDGARVMPPPHAFLQATREGEAALQSRVLALAGKAKKIADLFAGLGTFALVLARQAKVHAVEQDAPALAALAAAARAAPGLKPLTTERRDLFKLPLGPAELKPYDAVVLDPPRAGAEAQARALAASAVPRVVYVSCDAMSFARDAAILVKAGFTPGAVQPIDQFLFSTHIELVAGFTRG